MPGPLDQSLAAALVHHRDGRLDQAEAIYQRLLVDFPDHPTPLNLFGALAIATGRFQLAETLLRRAVAANPNEANYHSNLGESLRHQGKLDEAIAAYRRALVLDPRLSTTHSNLGIALAASDRLPEAIAAFDQATTLQPNNANAWSNFGNALQRIGAHARAVDACEQACALRPNEGVYQKNLGAALAADGRFDQAIAADQRSLRTRPNDVETLSNSCSALSAAGRDDEAISAGERAVEIDAQSVQAHWNLAVTLLRAGEWSRGWVEYEWRWKRMAMPFSQQPWDGVLQDNQTVLLHAEQGFGDAIQFARFVPVMAKKIHDQGGRIIVRVSPPLTTLFQSLDGVDQILPTADSVPPFDVHLPFMSLARILEVTPDNIAGNVPYLHVEHDGPVRGTGVCFSGSPTHNNDRFRSIPPAIADPLLAVLNEPVSLNPNDNPALTDFAATAQLIAKLERVICVDTAVAHLAGAMGKAVWMLLPSVADWRWLRNAETTPWYPSARLFRQGAGESWAAVIDRVIAALRKDGNANLVPSLGTPGEG